MSLKSFRVVAGLVGGAVVAVLIVVSCLWLFGGDRTAEAKADAPRKARRSSPAAPVAKPASTIRTAANRATTGDNRRTTSQPAHVEPYEQTEVYAKASGFIEKVHVDIGDHVEKDQVLAELWIPEMEQDHVRLAAVVEEARSAVAQAEASTAAAKAMVEAARAQLRETAAKIAQHDAEVAFRKSEHERYARLSSDAALNGSLVDEKLNQLRSAEAALAAAKAAIDSADADVKVNEAKQLQAKADLAHAQARLKVAQANLRRSEILLAYRQIRAPYPAIVTRRVADTGDFVTTPSGGNSEPLFVVARVDKLRIVADIPEAESALIAVGQAASLAVDAIAGRTFRGQIKRTTDVLDAKTRTLRIEAELDEPAVEIRPGMFGVLNVVLRARSLDATHAK